MTDIEALETTYLDLCAIKRKQKSKNEETGIVETVEVLVDENVKCGLSKSDNQLMEADGVGKLSFSHKLFINPNTDIKEGDIIEVHSMGKKSIYLASKPFYYPSHIEILLTYKERA